MMSRTRNIDTVVLPWFIRLGLYVVIAIVGAVGVARGWVDQATVDGWLDQSGYLAALIGGVVASLNVTRDRKVGGGTPAPTSEAPEVPAPVVTPAPISSSRSLLDELRDSVSREG